MRRLSFIMLAMLCVCFSSCNDDDDGKTESANDPAGTVVLNMTSGNSAGYQIGDVALIFIDSSNNFTSNQSDVEFVSVGKVKSLSRITTIPTTGWAKSVAVTEEKAGYIMRSNSGYARIFVEKLHRSDEFSYNYGKITGVTIKYQAPWEVEK